MGIKKKLFMVIAALITLFTLTTVASAAGPLCEIYWMSSSDGVGPGGTSTIQTYLNDIGYNAKRYENTSAYYVRRTMDDDAVFVIVSHGLPGRASCYGGTTVSAYAVSSDDDNYSLAAAFDPDDLEKIRFAYYGTCYSAATDSTYGKLTSYTISLGARSTLGFVEAVSDAHATYFEKRLFYHLKAGNNVNTSKNLALSDTYSYYGDYGNVDSAQTLGYLSTKITPAAYGNQ